MNIIGYIIKSKIHIMITQLKKKKYNKKPYNRNDILQNQVFILKKYTC